MSACDVNEQALGSLQDAHEANLATLHLDVRRSAAAHAMHHTDTAHMLSRAESDKDKATNRSKQRNSELKTMGVACLLL